MAKKTRSEARKRRHIRVRKYVAGTSEKPRLNVFRSINQIYAQVIDDESGRTIVSASSNDLHLRDQLTEKSRIEKASLVGAEIAKRAIEKGVSKVVFDRGGFRYLGRVKALAEGARKGGLDF